MFLKITDGKIQKKKILRTFVAVKRMFIIVCALVLSLAGRAQTEDPGMDVLDFSGEEFKDARNQIWYWAGKQYVYEGENIWTILMPELPVYKPLRFRTRKEQQKYNRLVYNVKKVLPLAQQVNAMIQETYKVLETLPDKKAKQEHIKKIEKEIMRTYKPEMKKLTYSQGKLLIKLVDRQCNQSSYEVVKAFLGPTRATFYQLFAWTFKASLKKEYDPEGEDKLTERVVRQVEAGVL